MRDKINKLLSETEPLKAREIAKQLELDRSEVNAFLHRHPLLYVQDGEYRWSLVSGAELELTLPTGWVNSNTFEQAISAVGSVLDGNHAAVRIAFASKCKTMIDCTARLLALINQLVHRGKQVTVDFTDAGGTLTYLNRAGFFDLLHQAVTVLPKRPAGSAAKRYKGQSDTLVEFGAVDPATDNSDLIEQLTDKFVQQSSVDYKVAAVTVFGEFIGNVSEHSQSPIHGFAGLQKYSGKRDHIQTVVTDSGVGIASTLRPSLKAHYPTLFRRFGEKSLDTDIGLVMAAISKGEISRFGKARGLGFKSSREQAIKFEATLTVRQEEFCLRFEYRNERFAVVEKQSHLARLLGTHICFDFYVE